MYGTIALVYTNVSHHHAGKFFACTRVINTTTVDFVRNTRSNRGFVNILFLNVTFYGSRPDIANIVVPI